MRRSMIVVMCLIGIGLAYGAHVQAAVSRAVVLRFSTMYGVDGPFIGDENPQRNIPGDDLPWQIRDADGVLLADGTLTITVRGLVFPNRADVPKEQRGINDEDEFRGVVSCLSEGDEGVTVVNRVTKGFPASRAGNAVINARVQLPNPCVEPVVFIVAGDELDWLAVTGIETD